MTAMQRSGMWDNYYQQKDDNVLIDRNLHEMLIDKTVISVYLRTRSSALGALINS